MVCVTWAAWWAFCVRQRSRRSTAARLVQATGKALTSARRRVVSESLRRLYNHMLFRRHLEAQAAYEALQARACAAATQQYVAKVGRVVLRLWRAYSKRQRHLRSVIAACTIRRNTRLKLGSFGDWKQWLKLRRNRAIRRRQ